jgi:hypothetical protein
MLERLPERDLVGPGEPKDARVGLGYILTRLRNDARPHVVTDTEASRAGSSLHQRLATPIETNKKVRVLGWLPLYLGGPTARRRATAGYLRSGVNDPHRNASVS